MTRLTSNSTLKLRVSTVGQVNSRGKTMCTGIGQPWHTEPSAIWMFWISVASRACRARTRPATPHHSTC
eukprot:1030998-Prymnesium_polylepis.1